MVFAANYLKRILQANLAQADVQNMFDGVLLDIYAEERSEELDGKRSMIFVVKWFACVLSRGMGWFGPTAA